MRNPGLKFPRLYNKVQNFKESSIQKRLSQFNILSPKENRYPYDVKLYNNKTRRIHDNDLSWQQMTFQKKLSEKDLLKPEYTQKKTLVYEMAKSSYFNHVSLKDIFN